MNLFKFFFPWTIAGLIGAATIGYAAEKDVCDINDPYCHRFTKAEEYFKKLNPSASEEEWQTLRGDLRAFTDPERMAAVMANPARFAEWIVALSDPDAVHLMLRCSQEPVMWNTWLRVMTDPEKMMKAAFVFMNPGMYMQWTFAPMNPQVHAKLAPLADDKLWADWTKKGTNPVFHEPLYSWINPQWWVDRMTWAMDPKQRP